MHRLVVWKRFAEKVNLVHSMQWVMPLEQNSLCARSIHPASIQNMVQFLRTNMSPGVYGHAFRPKLQFSVWGGVLKVGLKEGLEEVEEEIAKDNGAKTLVSSRASSTHNTCAPEHYYMDPWDQSVSHSSGVDEAILYWWTGSFGSNMLSQIGCLMKLRRTIPDGQARWEISCGFWNSTA